MYASKPCFRLYSCESSTLLSANSLHVLASLRDDSGQLVLTDPQFNVRCKRQAKHWKYGKLAVSDMKETVKLVAERLRPGGHDALFCTAQQFNI